MLPSPPPPPSRVSPWHPGPPARGGLHSPEHFQLQVRHADVVFSTVQQDLSLGSRTALAGGGFGPPPALKAPPPGPGPGAQGSLSPVWPPLSPHLVFYAALALIMQDWPEAMGVHGGLGVQGEVEGDVNRGQLVAELGLVLGWGDRARGVRGRWALGSAPEPLPPLCPLGALRKPGVQICPFSWLLSLVPRSSGRRAPLFSPPSPKPLTGVS